MARRRSSWTEELVNDEKAAIKRELDVLFPAKASRERLMHCVGKVRDLEHSDNARERLRCFIYIMSALVQHQLRPGLTERQVESLVIRAHTLLRVQGVKPGTSRLAFLYGELHQVRSLILRQDGEPWRSAWEQQVAHIVSKAAPPGGPAFQYLSMGNRALRLGNAALAHASFRRAEVEAAEPGVQSGNIFEHARIGSVRALRLAGRLAQSAALAAESLARGDLSRAFQKEMEWEAFCREVTGERTMSAMVPAVKKGNSHFQATYAVEAHLWSLGLQSKDWSGRLTKMSTLARNPHLKPRKLGAVFDAALVLEECYDTGIPLLLRIQKLGAVLADVRNLTNVDKELLVLAAAGRWLARIHSFAMANFTLREYEALSVRMSDGATSDVLGIAGDLLASPWYKESKWDGGPSEGLRLDDTLDESA